MNYNPESINYETVAFLIAALLIIGWAASGSYRSKWKNKRRDKKKSKK